MSIDTNEIEPEFKLFRKEISNIDPRILDRLREYFDSKEFKGKLKKGEVYGEIFWKGHKERCLEHPGSYLGSRYKGIHEKKLRIQSVEEVEEGKFMVEFELLVNHDAINKDEYILEARTLRPYDEKTKSILFKFYGIDAII